MIEVKNHRKMLIKLQQNLEKYDKIFLFYNKNKQELFLPFCDFLNYKNINKKIMIISTNDISENTKFTYCKISEQKALELRKLYYTYEFSDRFEILFEDGVFAELWNFFKSGLLNEEEIFTALLH